jgi:putative ATPase
MHLRNAPTAAMKEWGYGEGYRYPHSEGGHAAGVSYLPEALASRRYYEPANAGFEIKLGARLARLRSANADQPGSDQPGSDQPRVDPDSDQVAASESEPVSGPIENEP